jgi:hypothetical protein
LNRVATLSEDSSTQPAFVEVNLSNDSFPAQPATVWYPQRSDWTISSPGQDSAGGTHFFDAPSVNPAGFPAAGFPFRFTTALQSFGINHLLTPLVYESTSLAELSPADAARFRESGAQLSGNLTFTVGRLEESARLALTPGALFRDGPNRLGVIEVECDDNQPQVQVSLAEQSLSRDYPNWSNALEINLLVNARLGEAILGYQSMNSMNDVSNFLLERRGLTFLFRTQLSNHDTHDMSAEEIRAWLADAEYVRLRYVPVGTQPGTFSLALPAAAR